MSAREQLYHHIRRYVRSGLVEYGGHTQGGARLDAEAWRSAPLDDVVDALMVLIRAGLDPHLSRQAVEDGVAVARQQRAAIAAEVLTLMAKALPHHLAEPYDPCQDRGADWPCDVARAFRATADALKPAKSTTNDGDET